MIFDYLKRAKYYDIDEYCKEDFIKHFSKFVYPEISKGREVVFLCIGSDKSTGDSLAPLVGYNLSKYSNNLHIYGTLNVTVNAKNLTYVIEEINNTYNNPFIVAIDASFGRSNHIGKVVIEKGSLHPGRGVGKYLPPVGDINIKGVVATDGCFPNMILQTTSLGLVMKMAEFISDGIKESLDSFECAYDDCYFDDTCLLDCYQ